MLQRLPISVAQIKADNKLDNLLNKIRQIPYWEITKKVYINIIKSIEILNWYVFMNSKNVKLLIHLGYYLPDKRDLRRGDLHGKK